MSYLVMHINLLTLFNPNELHKYKTFIFYLLINIKMHWQKHITLFFPFFFSWIETSSHTFFFFLMLIYFIKKSFIFIAIKLRRYIKMQLELDERWNFFHPNYHLLPLKKKLPSPKYIIYIYHLWKLYHTLKYI